MTNFELQQLRDLPIEGVAELFIGPIIFLFFLPSPANFLLFSPLFSLPNPVKCGEKGLNRPE